MMAAMRRIKRMTQVMHDYWLHATNLFREDAEMMTRIL